MKVKPLHDRVVVLRLAEEEKTKGGIIIPDKIITRSWLQFAADDTQKCCLTGAVSTQQTGQTPGRNNGRHVT
jgi:hypothetical protein